MARHLHLDPVGGIAGDMFAGAMLDAWPELGEGLVAALHDAGLSGDVTVTWERVTDEVLAGTRFVVADPRERGRHVPPSNLVLQRGAGAHAHVPYRDVRARIRACSLAPAAKERALDIFALLAEAEAAVHGIACADDVELHEVGAQDAIADVVAAAWLIDRCQVCSASAGPVPLGAGRVESAHGLLPLPAPAAAHLLRGFATVDDGRKGERVTPTGCAIFKHLAPAATAPPGTLGVTGIGWGTKRFVGLPNVLRVLELDLGAAATLDRGLGRDTVALLSCDIDDQAPEDLAIAVDHLRAHHGVLDVSQAAAVGKKGRMSIVLHIVARLGTEETVARAVLAETTTLGVRVTRADRIVLPREQVTRGDLRGKRVRRPDGVVTTKAESDDLAELPSAAARAQRRRDVEGV